MSQGVILLPSLTRVQSEPMMTKAGAEGSGGQERAGVGENPDPAQADGDARRVTHGGHTPTAKRARTRTASGPAFKLAYLHKEASMDEPEQETMDGSPAHVGVTLDNLARTGKF